MVCQKPQQCLCPVFFLCVKKYQTMAGAYQNIELMKYIVICRHSLAIYQELIYILIRYHIKDFGDFLKY